MEARTVQEGTRSPAAAPIEQLRGEGLDNGNGKLSEPGGRAVGVVPLSAKVRPAPLRRYRQPAKQHRLVLLRLVGPALVHSRDDRVVSLPFGETVSGRQRSCTIQHTRTRRRPPCCPGLVPYRCPRPGRGLFCHGFNLSGVLSYGPSELGKALSR